MSKIKVNCETSRCDLAMCCLMAAGIPKKYAPQMTASRNVWKDIKGSKQFTITSKTNGKKLPGDILIVIYSGSGGPTGHTAVVVSSPNRK